MPHATPGPAAMPSGDRGFRSFTAEDLDGLTTRAGLAPGQRLGIRAAAAVLGFRTTSYVTSELIDWSAAPDDPIYRMVFPDEEMLPGTEIARIADMLRRQVPAERIAAAARRARASLPGDHAPSCSQKILPGAYRTGRDTVLILPARRQPTRPYGISRFDGAPLSRRPGRVMTARGVQRLARCLISHPEVRSVQFAGDDLLTLAQQELRSYLEPLLHLDQLESIEIDTSALAYWPHRFLTDPDADDTLRLFSQVTASGKALALMARFCHPRQLEPRPAADAVRRIQGTGAVIRTQGPLIGTVNDTPSAWAAMWRTQVRMGMVPHVMVIEPAIGTKGKFTVPLARAQAIFAAAYANVTGLARTVRGPVMPAGPGTVCLAGIAGIGTQKVFVLHFTQASDPDLIGQPLFAAFDPQAACFTDLKPATGTRFPDSLATARPVIY
jgi:L-lysine 2,3-aminomutase